MSSPSSTHRRRRRGRLLIGAVAGAGVVGASLSAGVAEAATTASFAGGVLTVVGDAQPNNIVISRNAAGIILVNGGAVPVSGGTPTVANTARISVAGLGGADTLTLNEASGALPRARTCPAASATTRSPAAPATTRSRASGATTPSSARAASTRCPAAAATTR